MIKFESVTKIFGDGTQALSEVSFEVENGELVLITGPSGSGKTTIMRLLLKEHIPTEGDIHFKDYFLSEIRGSRIPYHRRQIGVVFQDYRLISELNVWENIALPLQIIGKSQDEIESRVTDLLKLISLTEKAWVFPKQLSGGEAQRVGIARALATGPNVIFADEPTGNLDKDSSLLITKLFQKINELGTTIILATHDTSVLDALNQHRKIEIIKGRINFDSDQKTSKTSKKETAAKTQADDHEPEEVEKKPTLNNSDKKETDKPADEEQPTKDPNQKDSQEKLKDEPTVEISELDDNQKQTSKRDDKQEKKVKTAQQEKPDKGNRFGQILGKLLKKNQQEKEEEQDEKSE